MNATTPQAETFTNRTCFCPGDCNCNAPAWMVRPVFCGCTQHSRHLPIAGNTVDLVVTSPPRYFEAPDGYDEPTIWDRNDKHPDQPMPVLSRFDIEAEYRDELWPLIVQAVCRKTRVFPPGQTHPTDGGQA